MRRHNLSPVLVALFTGLLHLTSPRTASAAPPTITIGSPTPGAVEVDQEPEVQSIDDNEGSIPSGALMFWGVVIRGNYQAWTDIIPSGPDTCGYVYGIQRRNLLTGVTTTIYSQDPSHGCPVGYPPKTLEISPSGDVYFIDEFYGWNNYVMPYRYVAASGMVEEFTPHLGPVFATGFRVSADDHSAALGFIDGYGYREYSLFFRDLSTPDAVEVYVDTVTSLPEFAVANGWLAYTREENGVVQVFRRYPDGVQEQVSLLAEDAVFLSIAPNGGFRFLQGGVVWLSLPGAAPVPAP